MAAGQRLSVPAPRVGIYNRCSTEEEAQKNALAVQAEESREIATVRKNWIIAAQYIESESGTTVKNRTEYQRLLEDMEKDLFDIVMIKSIDRLTRSAKDWYLFLNKLTESDKQLYIYMEDKFYTPDDSLISGIKAILAEEFSRELSKKIKNSHGRRQQMHRQKKPAGLNITRPMFGWDKVGKDVYRLNDAEAEAYRTAFDMAGAGKGFYTIANYMYDQGVRGKNGGRISNVQWRKMLYSPRAHGAMVIHTREYDFDTKRFVSLPPEEWITIENALPPIVSEAYQSEVLSAIAGRKTEYSLGTAGRDMSQAGRYDLSGKIICAECRAVYYRTTFRSGGRRIAEWKCSTALKKGRKASNEGGCDNINLLEEEFHKMIGAACKKQYDNLFGAQRGIADEAFAIVRRAVRDDPAKSEVCRLEKECERLERKKRVLLDKLVNETITDTEFAQCREELDSRMGLITDKLRLLQQQSLAYAGQEERLEAVKEALRNGDVVDRAKLKALVMRIDQIYVYPDRKVEILFNRTKLQGLMKLYGSKTDSAIDDDSKNVPCRIRTEYIHENGSSERRREINQQILNIFRDNPGIRAKDLPEMLGVGYSYVNTSIKALKKAGKLRYEKGKAAGTGIWRVQGGNEA